MTSSRIRAFIGFCATTLMASSVAMLASPDAAAGTDASVAPATHQGLAAPGRDSGRTPLDATRAAPLEEDPEPRHSSWRGGTPTTPEPAPAPAPEVPSSAAPSSAATAPSASGAAPRSPQAEETAAAKPPVAAAPEQAPAPSAPAGNPDASWTQAWSTADATNIRSWFEANTGPTRPVSGTVPGGTIRSQADADRLTGRIVTSGLSVACTCTLQDFVLQNSELRITGGQVTVRNAMIDGKGNTSLVGVFTALGSADVTVSRVEITGHNDGIRAYASSVAGEYVYIHGRATANPRNHHQDGIQTIGGATSFDRSYVDMTGANTSATLIKPDASPIPKASVNRSVMIGGAFTFHVHDGPKGAPRNVDLRDNLTAPGYGRGIMSTWELSNPAASMITCSIRLSGTSRMIPLVDGARI